MAFDPKAFVADILKDVQLDDTTKKAFEAITSNAVVAKRFEDGILRQSDYSSKVNEYTTKLKAVQDYWDGLKTWEKDTKVAFETDRKALDKRLTDEGIGVDNGTQRGGIDEKAFQERITQLSQEAVQFTALSNKMGMNHFKEFGEVLDLNQVIEQAQKNRVDITTAYDQLVRPKRDEIQTADLQKRIDQARKEGAEEALKNVKFPTGDPNTQFSSGVTHALDHLEKKPSNPEFGAMSAVAAFAAAKRAGTVIV